MTGWKARRHTVGAAGILLLLALLDFGNGTGSGGGGPSNMAAPDPDDDVENTDDDEDDALVGLDTFGSSPNIMICGKCAMVFKKYGFVTPSITHGNESGSTSCNLEKCLKSVSKIVKYGR
jgi:hypothetical protein